MAIRKKEYCVDTNKIRYVEHPYYDPRYSNDFLVEGNFDGAVLHPDDRKVIKQWLIANQGEGSVYMVGNRVSFTSSNDAIAFKLRWG